MEVTNNRKNTAYAAITRVYSPTKGSSAYAYAQRAETLETGRVNKPVIEKTIKKAQAKSRLRPLTRFALIISMLVFAVALLAVIFRYYQITQSYAMVVDLEREITNTKRSIRELSVALNSAVSIQEAKIAAENFDLTYPTADQYIRAGDALNIKDESSNTDNAADDANQDNEQNGDEDMENANATSP